jgi:hypothetical protein
VKAWIYFACCGTDGPIKIGRAADPHKRVRDLAVGSPIDLVILGAILSERPEEEEAEIHERLREHCVRGEWFVAEMVHQEMKRLETRLVAPDELKSCETPNVDAFGTNVNVRALPEEMLMWKAAAHRAGVSLSQWARNQLDAAAAEEAP